MEPKLGKDRQESAQEPVVVRLCPQDKDPNVSKADQKAQSPEV